MNKILSIIVPSYQETEQEIFPLISSIFNQVNLSKSNIEIIIVRDGTTELNLELFNVFNLDIKQIVTAENKGPGVARQEGLNVAIGKYIIFSDADDIFYTNRIISIMISEMENQGWDILKTFWLEEYFSENQNQLLYMEHKTDNTWLHGKIFRKSFIDYNELVFHPDLRVHEDTYFLGVAAEATEKIGVLEMESYIWRWGANSITRHNEGIYRYESAVEFIKSCTWMHEKIEQIKPSSMRYKIVQFILYHYFVLHSDLWADDKYAPYRHRAEQALTQYTKPFMHYWTDAPEDYIRQVYNKERNNNFQNQIETETLYDWLLRLKLIEGG